MQTKALAADRKTRALIFAALFLVILALKWASLTEPPVWDAAMSVFPAAITLEEHDFDYGYLLAQPRYSDGGPNVHSLSPITLLTAVAIRLIGGGPSLFPVLHLVHFAIAAFAFTGLFRLSELVLGPRLAAATTATTLIFPLVLTQIGFMYLEIAMMASFVYAILAWQRGDGGRAAAWATVAVLIKGSGIVVAAALAGSALFDPRSERRSVKNALVVAVAPLVALFLQGRILTSTEPPDIGGHMTVMVRYLLSMPDLALLLIAFLIASTVAPPWRKVGSSGNEPSVDLQITGIFVVMAFIVFFMAIPFVGLRSAVLPRYYAVIFPFLLVGLVAMIQKHGGTRIAVLALLSLSVISVVNRNGDLYPERDVAAFTVAERSGAYRDLLELQIQGTNALVEAEKTQPVFYAQPEHYRFNYPLMGYASGPLSNGHSIEHEEPYRNARLSDFPDTFTMLYEFNWIGGEEIQWVWEQAVADPSRSVNVSDLTVGDYTISLIEVTTRQDG